MSDKKQLKPYAPSVGVRLLWWFGIYFGAQLPFYIRAPGLIIWIGKFPEGALAPFVPSDFVSDPGGILGTLGYAVYLGHFILNLVVRTKRVFFLLMIILILLLCLTLYGWALVFRDANL